MRLGNENPIFSLVIYLINLEKSGQNHAGAVFGHDYIDRTT